MEKHGIDIFFKETISLSGTYEGDGVCDQNDISLIHALLKVSDRI